MGTTASADRRDPSTPRRTIKTTVDLTPGDERDSWQADAIDVSSHGMSMRASVLPEVGEALAVRFKPDGLASVSAQAEVVWASDQGSHAGSFGVRFTEVSAQAERSLRRMLDAKDDVMVREGDRPMPPPADARVKLFIHGMDAPLRAKVRTSDSGEVIVGSELSFLKLGDKVDVDGAGAKVTGAIVKVDVEVDAKTRVPRLVLTIDLGGKRKPDLGTAPTVLAESPRASEPELPTVKPVVKPTKTAIVRDDAPAERPVARRAAHATNVLGADEAPEAVSAERSQPESELSLIEPPPGWITQGMRVVRQAGEKAAPVMRRAVGAVGELAQRIRDRKAKGDAPDDEAATGDAPRRGLRPQHKATTSATASTSSDTDALATQPGRTRKIGLYAVVGLIVAAGSVAYASTSGPKVETPRPQVAVAAEGTADPNAPAADPNAAPTDPNAPAADPNAMTVEATPGALAQQADPRWVNGRNPRTPDLAAAAGSQGDMEAPVIQQPAQRAARPMAQRPLMQPGFAAQRPMGQPAMAQRQVMAQRPMAAPVAAQRPVSAPVVAQGPVRPAVFGNPAVRSGTVLRLRMDGPIGAISGVGARGAAIVMTLPGRHSLDMAAPLAQIDPRIAGAGVMNRATGAELTLRFREPAPPFVARSRGNVLEIVLAPTPGQPVRAAVRAPLVIGPRR